MQDWLSFFSFTFWVYLIFFYLKPGHFLKLIITAEIVWILLYIISLLGSLEANNIFLLNNSLYMFGFAAAEYCLGIIIFIIYTHVNNTIVLDSNNKQKKKIKIKIKN